MDRRKLLSAGMNLEFPGMNCTIEAVAGKGSNGVVYLGTYPDQQRPELKHRVLIKELFPYHPKGAIYRDARNCIRFEEDEAEYMQLHRISFERGNEIHLRLLEDYPQDLDANLNTFSLNETLYTVLGFSGGRSLDKELELPGADQTLLTIHIRRMLGVLDVLEAFHKCGYVHMDLSPDNILLIGDGKRERMSLIDYNSVHTLEEIREGTELYFSAKKGYTAPEICMQRIGGIGFGTDLYALTCVFYRCITGRSLSELEMTRQAVPDLSGARCLERAPDTVVSMVRKILRRGLAAVSRRRYQNTMAMRRDLEELQDRIDGRGITHWALWEAGRAGVLHTVRTNPALEYIREEEKMYPVVGMGTDGTAITLTELYRSLVSAHQITTEEEKAVLLLGGGGMGKTTALLRMAYLQPAGYSLAEPAIMYLSLYGFRSSGRNEIKNRILEQLKFKPETENMEMARHELLRLLSAPVHTPWGERPKLLLLLDGYNEAPGETKELVGEISELSELPGLRILLTGRSAVMGLTFSQIRLRQLSEAEVSTILSENGILLPENVKLRQLLRTPMMLAVFIRATLEGEKQLFLEEEEPRKYLLSAYLSAMLKKEAKNLPEDSSEKWRADAAVHYVLPEISRYLKTRGASVSDRELLRPVEKCFRRLWRRDMTVIFPQWIGHLSDIRGGAESAEEWYGLVVHNILWRRFGLLVREENGHYRIAHQLLEEYLAEACQVFEARFLRRQRVRTGVAAICLIVLAGAGWRWGYLPYKASHMEEAKAHYDEALADNVLSTALLTYANAAKQYESAWEVLQCLKTEPLDEDQLENNLQKLQQAVDTASMDYRERASGYAQSLMETGDVMPWSEKPLEQKAFEEWMSLPLEQAGQYQKHAKALVQMKKDPRLWEEFGEDYMGAFQEAIACDARVNGKCYKLLIEPELEGMNEHGSAEDRNQRHLYLSAAADYPRQNELTRILNQEESGDQDGVSVEQYQRLREEAWENLRRNPAVNVNKRNVNKEGEDDL